MSFITIMIDALMRVPKVLLIVTIGCLLYYNWTRRSKYILGWKLDGPFAFPIIGNLWLLSMYDFSSVPSLFSMFKKYGHRHKILRFWAGTEMYVVTYDANVASQINRLALEKSKDYQYLATPLLTKAIQVNKNIPEWRAVRKDVTKMFNFHVLKTYIPIFYEESLLFMDNLMKYSRSGESFYVAKTLVEPTCNSILKTTIGIDSKEFEEGDTPFSELLHDIFWHFWIKLIIPVFRNNFIYSLIGFRKREVQNMEKGVVYCQRAIDKMERKGLECIPGQSFLKQMLQRSENISKEDIIPNTLNVIAAGMDTSMMQMATVFLLLALHPDVQDRVYEKVISILDKDVSQCPSYEDLMKLDYLNRVLKECMRMIPVGPLIGRTPSEDLTVTTESGKEYMIPKGTSIGISIYGIHHSSEYYDNPEIFDPERWLPEEVAKRNPHCFIPFSSGPRDCVGSRYAMLQMKIVVATNIRKFRILPSKHCPTLKDVTVEFTVLAQLGKNCQIKLEERI